MGLLLFIFTQYIFSNQKQEKMSQKILEEYLVAPLEDARRMMLSFSDEQLQKYWNDYQQKKSIQEKRILWLIEEYYSREARQISEQRLFYLFLVCVFLLLLFFILLFVLYKKTKYLENLIQQKQ